MHLFLFVAVVWLVSCALPGNVVLTTERLPWLQEVNFGIRGKLHKQPEPKSYLTTDNPRSEHL